MSRFISLETSKLFHLSSKEQLTNEVLDPTKKWFSLGQNTLDGSFIPMPPEMPDELERGWWSEEFAGEDGRFAQPPTITGTVKPQPAFMLYIYGDSQTGNHPVDMDITFWDDEDELIRVDQVRDNGEVNYEHVINVPMLSKVRVKFLRNSIPNAELRILEIKILLEDEYIHTLMDDPNRRIYCKVNINYLDPFKSYEVHVDPASTFRLSNAEQLINGIEETDQKWFSLTNNSLDGTFRPMPDNYQKDIEVGWWSNDWSDENGEFANPPMIIINLTPQPVVGFTMIGDRRTNNYPVDFDIYLYNHEDELLHKQEVRGNTDVQYSTRFVYNNVKQYKIFFHKVSIPNDQIRLVEVNSKFAETYMAEDLFNVDLFEEVGYISNGLPLGNISANEITVDIADAGNEFDLTRATAKYKGLLIRNRKITAHLGVELYEGYIKWYPFGVYYTTRWDVKNGDITASVTGRDVLELLRQDEFLDTRVMENKSLYELFDLVLGSFSLLELQYNIDEELKNIKIPYVWFGAETYRMCLSRLCDISNVDVFVTRNNVIQVTKPKTLRQIDYTFTDETSIYDRSYPSAFHASTNCIRMEGQTFKPSGDKKLFTTASVHKCQANYRGIYKIVSTQTPILSLKMEEFTLPEGLVLHSAKQTCWGILADIENTTSQDINFTVQNIGGTILETDQHFTVYSKDEEDIALNGTQEKKHNSEFLQRIDYAQEFADNLLDDIRRSPMDIEVDTRGHVYINLLDSVKIANQDDSGSPEYQLIEVKTHWDGGLESTIRARFM